MTALPHEAPVNLPRRSGRSPRNGALDSSTKARVVPLRPVQQMKRSTFITMVATLLSVSLLALLLLNTVLSQGSFRRYELMSQANDLTAKEQTLSKLVGSQESPVEIERRARELGMVKSENPVFLDLATGQVRGEPSPAPTPVATEEPASSIPSPGASPSASGANPADTDLGVGTARSDAVASPNASNPSAVTQPDPNATGEQPLGLTPQAAR